ncbi:hypothetical protein K438DRAFT_1755413 [Mycena galopus ATCC 62051]|nr:hypothetical protein K438DRAFT_1755413 [Mycena galopus ATCC 62051]
MPDIVYLTLGLCLITSNYTCLARRMWGPGMILFRLLAVRRSLGEPWNLNGDSFLQIRAGNLVSAPPQAVEDLHAMWNRPDCAGDRIAEEQCRICSVGGTRKSCFPERPFKLRTPVDISYPPKISQLHQSMFHEGVRNTLHRLVLPEVVG